MTAFSAPTARRNVTNAMADEAARRTARQKENRSDERPFEPGEAVVYAAHGVGRIEKIGTEEIAGYAVEVILVSFPANRMTLRIPKARAREAGLRRVATRERVDEAMAVIAGRPRAGKGLWARRSTEIQTRIATGELLQIAEVVRDLRRFAISDKGSFSERQLFVSAFERLTAEVAILLDTDEPAAAERLTAIIRKAEAAAPTEAPADDEVDAPEAARLDAPDTTPSDPAEA